MSKNLFITGTGTEVGKTYITGLLIKKLKEAGHNPAYFKAAMSGNLRRKDGSLIPGDAAFVQEISKISQPLDSMCPYVYEAAVSPHLASQLEGNPVQMETVQKAFHALTPHYDLITVEGSGGILCPLCFDQDKLQLEDIIKALKLSSLIVADAGLGTINAVVLTAEYMKSKKLPVKGIILNRFHPGNVMEEDNRRMCEALTGLPVLACVEENSTVLPIDAQELAALYE